MKNKVKELEGEVASRDAALKKIKAEVCCAVRGRRASALSEPGLTREWRGLKGTGHADERARGGKDHVSARSAA
eukprot:3735212-Rhodomonas_salina.1